MSNEIVPILIRLKQALNEHGGEVLSITLNKAGVDALTTECQSFYSCPIKHLCRVCGRAMNMVLGIKVEEGVSDETTRRNYAPNNIE